MLSLKWCTPVSWVKTIENDLATVLIDHAHCEKKAAGSAMSMIFSYVEQIDLVRALSAIVKEELEHFEQVLALLERRGITMTGQPQSRYGARLRELCRTEEPDKLIDRLLVSALIEARSCERFTLLGEHLKDLEVAAFFGTLLEAEARHYGVYLRLARAHADEATVARRLDALATEEARIIRLGDPIPRLHA